jgi:hypothetical protein
MMDSNKAIDSTKHSNITVTFSMQGYEFLAIISSMPHAVGSERKKDSNGYHGNHAIKPVSSNTPVKRRMAHFKQFT